MQGTSLDSLIREAQQGNKEAAERLIIENSGLIWSVARRYFGRGVDPDDLYQLGCVGFLKAVQGFDLQFGTMFSTYAVPKIAGEIRRFLRDDGTVKVSRTLKEQSASIKAVRHRLTGALHRNLPSVKFPPSSASRRKRSPLQRRRQPPPSPSNGRLATTALRWRTCSPLRGKRSG